MGLGSNRSNSNGELPYTPFLSILFLDCLSHRFMCVVILNCVCSCVCDAVSKYILAYKYNLYHYTNICMRALARACVYVYEDRKTTLEIYGMHLIQEKDI